LRIFSMHPAFTHDADGAIKLVLSKAKDVDETLANLPGAVAQIARGQHFAGKRGQIVRVPGPDGAVSHVLAGIGDGENPLYVAAISAVLEAGTYALDGLPSDWSEDWVSTGWADGAYRFDRYLAEKHVPPRLLLSGSEKAQAAQCRQAEAVDLVRDLVNTPAGDMGPDAIEAAVRDLAKTYGAEVEVTTGDELLDANYPMVHAVGRAADIAPRFIELIWGKADAPKLALVGKGVSFDTGGLNIKTGNGMRIMKKDMGGAAHAIALAKLVMDAKLPVNLKLYVPTVENAISGNAFRPGDVINSRKGLTVEIDNTDAEGRLILGDALARASEDDPDLLIDFATLTGAARVAVGPDLAPFYTDDEGLAAEINDGAQLSGDPAWRMPLWRPYLTYLESPIADIVNSGGRMAGSVTAALFLQKFVEVRHWVHLDVWAWREAKYGRPAGAAACGLRAMWATLQNRYG
jgi:leucyl aminopeptidase